MDYFKTADMDTLSLHVVRALHILVTSASQVGVSNSPLQRRLWYLGEVHRKLLIPTSVYSIMGEEMISAIDFRDRPDGAFTGPQMREVRVEFYWEAGVVRPDGEGGL